MAKVKASTDKQSLSVQARLAISTMMLLLGAAYAGAFGFLGN